MIDHTFVVLAYKESQYLEECIKSVLNQSLKTNVVIATSTPNKYIKSLAEKYNLKILINKESKGIAYDFNFAVNCAKTKLVTIAHQDDIYERTYAEEILKTYKNHLKSSIIFTDYFEIKDEKREYKNRNLMIKRFLLFSLKLGKFKHFRRNALRFGNAIC